MEAFETRDPGTYDYINRTLFSRTNVDKLFDGKFVLIMGDNATRLLYQDFIHLIENNLTMKSPLDIRNHSMEEEKTYNDSYMIKYCYIEGLDIDEVSTAIMQLKKLPDVILINSCLWDIMNWGSPISIRFRSNLVMTIRYLKILLPTAKVLYVPTIPQPVLTSKGIYYFHAKFPHSVEATNKYLEALVRAYNIDICERGFSVDLLMNYEIHGRDWIPDGFRYITQMCFYYFRVLWGVKL